MWTSIATLKSISHALMWASAIFAILAASATGLRYYIDRRAGELGAQEAARREDEKEAGRRAREDALKSDLAVSKNLQQEAQTKLAELEIRTASRKLTAEQKIQIATLARDFCSQLGLVNVTAAQSNLEAQQFGLEIVSALRVAGCKSELALPIPGLTPDVVGVHVGVRNPADTPVGAKKLAQILSAANIKFSVTQIKPDFFSNDLFVLVVGAKN